MLLICYKGDTLLPNRDYDIVRGLPKFLLQFKGFDSLSPLQELEVGSRCWPYLLVLPIGGVATRRVFACSLHRLLGLCLT